MNKGVENYLMEGSKNESQIILERFDMVSRLVQYLQLQLK